MSRVPSLAAATFWSLPQLERALHWRALVSVGGSTSYSSATQSGGAACPVRRGGGRGGLEPALAVARRPGHARLGPVRLLGAKGPGGTGKALLPRGCAGRASCAARGRTSAAPCTWSRPWCRSCSGRPRSPGTPRRPGRGRCPRRAPALARGARRRLFRALLHIGGGAGLVPARGASCARLPGREALTDHPAPHTDWASQVMVCVRLKPGR